MTSDLHEKHPLPDLAKNVILPFIPDTLELMPAIADPKNLPLSMDEQEPTVYALYVIILL
jgi:hypothetical protein